MCWYKTVMKPTYSENDLKNDLKLRGQNPNYQLPHKQAQAHIYHKSGLKLN